MRARRRDPRQRHARAPGDPALINLNPIPSKVKLLALPAKWRSESAPDTERVGQCSVDPLRVSIA
jgi:hypothetical protein